MRIQNKIQGERAECQDAKRSVNEWTSHMDRRFRDFKYAVRLSLFRTCSSSLRA